MRQWCIYGTNVSQQVQKMKLINSITSIAVIYASVFIGYPEASAQTSRCSIETLGNSYYYGSSGSRTRMSEDMLGNKTIRGTPLDGGCWKKRCTTNMLGKTTCLNLYRFLVGKPDANWLKALQNPWRERQGALWLSLSISRHNIYPVSKGL